MTRYKQTEFSEEDSSSIGGVQLNEPSSSTGMQIRYHTARVSAQQNTIKTTVIMNNVLFM